MTTTHAPDTYSTSIALSSTVIAAASEINLVTPVAIMFPNITSTRPGSAVSNYAEIVLETVVEWISTIKWASPDIAYFAGVSAGKIASNKAVNDLDQIRREAGSTKSDHDFTKELESRAMRIAYYVFQRAGTYQECENAGVAY